MLIDQLTSRCVITTGAVLLVDILSQSQMHAVIIGSVLFIACSGGQQWSECTGGSDCVATCANIAPVCDRHCFPGCRCPHNKPILHHGECIAADECQGQCLFFDCNCRSHIIEIDIIYIYESYQAGNTVPCVAQIELLNDNHNTLKTCSNFS